MNQRFGNFTSSEIHKLMTDGKAKGTFGKPFYTYIKQKKREAKLGQNIDREAFSYATSWGSCIEGYVNTLLGMEYHFRSKETIFHKEISRWCGTPDLTTNEKVSDVKSPFTLTSFCDLVEDCQTLETFKSEHPDFYWQLISNAILTDKNVIELIVFCPKFEELGKIMEYIDSLEIEDKLEYEWIFNAILNENYKKIPFLINDNYQSLNKFQFEVPQEDKNLLTDRVQQAVKLLNQ